MSPALTAVSLMLSLQGIYIILYQIQDKSGILLVIITIGSNYTINRDKSDSVL